MARGADGTDGRQLARRLDEMNQRWTRLKSKSLEIRSVTEKKCTKKHCHTPKHTGVLPSLFCFFGRQMAGHSQKMHTPTFKQKNLVSFPLMFSKTRTRTKRSPLQDFDGQIWVKRCSFWKVITVHVYVILDTDSLCLEMRAASESLFNLTIPHRTETTNKGARSHAVDPSCLKSAANWVFLTLSAPIRNKQTNDVRLIRLCLYFSAFTSLGIRSGEWITDCVSTIWVPRTCSTHSTFLSSCRDPCFFSSLFTNTKRIPPAYLLF